MKREILFRGKKISDSRVFVYGTYLFDKNKELPHIIVDSKGIYYPIIYDTLGQLIGAIDGEGNKVFEDDILYCDLEGVYDRVIFHQDWGGFVLYNNSMDIIDGVIVNWDKVVGNIHDNPNLLSESN